MLYTVMCTIHHVILYYITLYRRIMIISIFLQFPISFRYQLSVTVLVHSFQVSPQWKRILEQRKLFKLRVTIFNVISSVTIDKRQSDRLRTAGVGHRNPSTLGRREKA